MNNIAEVFIPIILFLVSGLVLITFIYFRSRERQMMIDKGMTPEQIAELFKSKRNPYTWLKIGVITIFAGLGIGFGILMDNAGYNEGYIPLFIITLFGVGFVAAFFVARKFEKEDEQNKLQNR